MPEVRHANELTKLVTIGIKTIERPDVLKRCVDSIRAGWPDLEIVVADDSEEPQQCPGTRLLPMEYDSGLSAGRNLILKAVTTPYVLVLDDDMVFLPETRIDQLLGILENSDLDIIGLTVNPHRPYCHSLTRDGNDLLVDAIARDEGASFTRCEFIHNVFLGRTESVGGIRWDPRLKLGEHEDFYLRAKGKLKIALSPIPIWHEQTRNAKYNVLRHRHDQHNTEFATITLRKHGLQRVLVDGVVTLGGDHPA